MLREPNAQVHLAATAIVVVLGVVASLPKGEWYLIIGAIMAVWVAEAMNTALEALANAAVPNVHPLVRNAKDVAAGGVLIAAIGAAVIGSMVFLPHLSRIIH